MHKMQREIEIVSFETFLNTDLLSWQSVNFCQKDLVLIVFKLLRTLPPPFFFVFIFLSLCLRGPLFQGRANFRQTYVVLGSLFLPFHNFMFNFNVSVFRPISSRFKSPPAESLRPLCDLHIFVKFAKQKIPYPR